MDEFSHSRVDIYLGKSSFLLGNINVEFILNLFVIRFYKYKLISIVHHFFLNQGSPEFVTSFECVHYFEWRTSLACKKNLFTSAEEVTQVLFEHKLKDGVEKENDFA